MRCAILGCGYIADYYMATLGHHDLSVVGCFDRDAGRRDAFAAAHDVVAYGSLDDLLADASVEMVWNLTNPRSHYETTLACLRAGKHVYSEKPLAMESRRAAELASFATEAGLGLSSAPCSLLSPAAQTLWKAVEDGRAGTVRLAYAEFEDGMVHRLAYPKWRNARGLPWPARDEFEVGCTFEHASYVLSWLAAVFGPAERVTAFSTLRVPDKAAGESRPAPDVTVGCIEYAGGAVARVSCGVVAPRDKSIRVFGDEATLSVPFVRDDNAPVLREPTAGNRYAAAAGHWAAALAGRLQKAARWPLALSGLSVKRRLPHAVAAPHRASGRNKPVDFLRGPAELAAAVREGRRSRLPAELGVHLVEIIETLQHPERFERPRRLTTTFEPLRPLWGRERQPAVEPLRYAAVPPAATSTPAR